MKKASNLAKNLGPGVSELAQETFKLLRAGDVEKYQQISKGETEQKSLEALRAQALKQREEFQNQIKQYELDQERLRQEKKEQQRQNNEYWR